MSYTTVHPYASAFATASEPFKRPPCSNRPNRPFIATRPIDVLPGLDEQDESSSPSPIIFARASFVGRRGQDGTCEKEKQKEYDESEEVNSKNTRRASRPRPVGFIGTENERVVGLEALLRATEAAPRRAPRAYAPDLVQCSHVPDADVASVTVTIEGLELDFPCPPFSATSDEEDDRKSEVTTACVRSSSTSPSTPGLPLTPMSSDEFLLPMVAPLSISKSKNPSSPSSSSSDLPANKACTIINATRPSSRSRNRFSARTASLSSVTQVFAPLDTVAANTLDLSLGVELTVTGVLEEVKREATKNRMAREAREAEEARGALQTEVAQAASSAAKDDTAWIDIDWDADDEEARDFYRSDIATHLQLFSPSLFSPFASSSSLSTTTSVAPTYTRHRRGGSSSSYLQQQFPPARRDSLPLPPDIVSSCLPPSHPNPLPLMTTPAPAYASFRRASASSIASNASNGSARSSRSSRSASSQRAARGTRQAKRRTARARVSAAQGVGKRCGGPSVGVHRKPLPATRTHIKAAVKGPSPLLDPTFPRDTTALSPASRVGPSPTSTESSSSSAPVRPPPRFPLPVDIALDEDVDVFSAEGATTGELKEEVVNEEGDDVLEPFMDVCVDIGGAARDGEDKRVDPSVLPMRSARTVMPCTTFPDAPSPRPAHASLSPPSTPRPHPRVSEPITAPPPFLLAPYSPTASSCGSGSGSHDADVESLFSSRDTASVYIDGAGRVLRSRWSVSTLATVVASPASSGGKSFFPKLQLPSRLSARLRGARERQQQREKEAREQKPEIIRPFPFFPTPTPPSPKRKSNPGPGRYVPKPELMPQKPAQLQQSQDQRPQSQSQPQPQSENQCTSNPARSPCGSSDVLSTSAKGKEREHFTVQYAQYRAHRSSPAHAAHAPRSSHSSRASSPDSLSAFPFELAGAAAEGAKAWHASGLSERGGAATKRGSRASAGAASDSGAMSRECEEWVQVSGGWDTASAELTGLRRKPIPAEIFMQH